MRIAILSDIHGNLSAFEAAWQAEAIVEQRIRVSPTRVPICDVAILRADAPQEEVTATRRSSASRFCPRRTVSPAPNSCSPITAPWALATSG